jgi:hypothetical protein
LFSYLTDACGGERRLAGMNNASLEVLRDGVFEKFAGSEDNRFFSGDVYMLSAYWVNPRSCGALFYLKSTKSDERDFVSLFDLFGNNVKRSVEKSFSRRLTSF